MATAVVSARPEALSFGYYARVLAKEIRYEFLKMARLRAYSLSVIGFPVMFYLLFGVANRHTDFARYLLASYSCFGMVGASLFGLGAGIAMERMQGWLELKQASPMPRLAYLAAKTVACSAFALIIVALLVTLGVTLGGVSMTPMEALKLAGITLAGALPFASMGLLLSLVMPATAAPGIINLIYLPMSFLSGLWMPLALLPHWMQKIAPAMPAYHYAQLALNIFGYAQPGGSMSGHWEALLGFTCLMLGAAWLIFTRSEARA
jgi:ABC-2 type transport system permease protein